MPTYADFFNSVCAPPSSSSLGPVKLFVNGNDDVVDSVQFMDLDASEQIVQGIRQRRNLEGGKDFDSGLTSPTGAEATEIPRNVIVLVIDTNWLFAHFSLFEQMESLIPRSEGHNAPVCFLLPLAVLRELDGHKNVFEQVYQNGQTWTKSALARRAISFMLENLLNRPDLFRCQKSQETHFSNIEARLHDADEHILDCCLYFQQKKGVQVGLLSNDRALCTRATAEGVPVLVWEASYSHAANLLAKLHPDLPPYLDTLRVNAVRKAEDAVMQSPLTPTALPIIDVRYPVAPFELIQTMSVITSSLLASQVHQVLLRYIANDNPEIFAYMLDRSPVFRGYPSDFDRVDYRTWDGWESGRQGV
ncbi:MAG: hypothetical protein CYPHOPRED_004702 [Cyphobasidiales sp. Tagirdzhanova-0007]|nr:MAG: hypothetical protein CYPHOPRED_004702 [Cyphobasidiales sp. Tagirdzhanova-0007]